MKNKLHGLEMVAAIYLSLPTVSVTAASAPNAGYAKHNLISDLATKALHTDVRVVNPWGIVAGPDSVWVNDNGTGRTTVYGLFGGLSSFTISIPAPDGGPAAPTGLVFNDTQSFLVGQGSRRAPATFIMATEDGTLAAWNHVVNGTNAAIIMDKSGSGAVYKGLDLIRGPDGKPQIYAANFHVGVVDVFDGNESGSTNAKRFAPGHTGRPCDDRQDGVSLSAFPMVLL